MPNVKHSCIRDHVFLEQGHKACSLLRTQRAVLLSFYLKVSEKKVDLCFAAINTIYLSNFGSKIIVIVIALKTYLLLTQRNHLFPIKRNLLSRIYFFWISLLRWVWLQYLGQITHHTQEENASAIVKDEICSIERVNIKYDWIGLPCFLTFQSLLILF